IEIQRNLLQEMLERHPDVDVVAGTAIAAEAAMGEKRNQGAPLTVVSFYLSIAIQDSLRLLVSRFDSSPDRILVLRKVTIFDLSIVSLVFCPLALVITTIGLSDLWLWVSLAFLIITHWVRLFLYFKFTGFSILQWFLYLCTLEVLPFTIIIGVVGHIKNL
ncbi:MAG: DUF4271 domain-containing protein, partial [Mucinivorans sp.]